MVTTGGRPQRVHGQSVIAEAQHVGGGVLHLRGMEWAEVLRQVGALGGFLGGGLGGLILGRVWDHRREDRFRHVEVKREAAVEFLDALAELRDLLQQRDHNRRQLQKAVDGKMTVEQMKKLRTRFAEEDVDSDSILLRADRAQERIYFLFDDATLRACVDLTESAAARYKDELEADAFGRAFHPLVDAFKIAARKELGLDHDHGAGRWRDRLRPRRQSP